jgi:cytochrome c
VHDRLRARAGRDRDARHGAGRDARGRGDGRHRLSAAAILLVLAAGAAGADPASVALSLQGDYAYGEYLATECLTCHQASGKAEGIPAIVGWDPEFLIRALVDYKTGARDHQVMRMATSVLGDIEIASLALYLATLEPH